MKAVISNRIYLNCPKGSDLDKELANKLTYEICQMPVSEFPLIIRNIKRVNDNIVSLPSGATRYIPEGYEIVDKRADVPVNIPTPGFVPRDNQQECVDYIQGNGLINAKVGWGKTIAGLAVAHKLQQKTLIICTTTTIRDMWIDEVKNWFGFEPGIIGSGKCQTDTPIVIANIQTLRNRAQDVSGVFGLVIVDEVHRAPAKTFSNTLDTLKAKYKMGLSGTLERKDGMHVVLEDYFGTDLFIAKQENTLTPTIHLWQSECELAANEFTPWANLITKLKTDPVYIAEVINVASLYAEAGHKVLVLSDRTDFLEYCHQQTEDYSLMVTGKVKDRKPIYEMISDPEGEASILWATQSIFSEGVSINELSCVVMATPINNMPLLEQIIGRIIRQAKDKLPPVAVDIALGGNTGKKHKNNRAGLYVNKAWPIKNMGQLVK